MFVRENISQFVLVYTSELLAKNRIRSLSMGKQSGAGNVKHQHVGVEINKRLINTPLSVGMYRKKRRRRNEKFGRTFADSLLFLTSTSFTY